MFDSQSSKINKNLLQILKEGISKDKEEISKLAAEEKSLREEIASENKNIKDNKLEDKEVFLKNKVKGLKKRLIKISDEIQSKNELLKAGYTSVKLLEEDISNKQGLQERAKENEGVGKIQILGRDLQNKLEQSYKIKSEKIEKEFDLEKEKQKQGILNLKKRNEAFKNEIVLKHKNLLLPRGKIKNEFKKKHENRLAELEQGNRFGLGDIQKNIILLNNKIK